MLDLVARNKDLINGTSSSRVFGCGAFLSEALDQMREVSQSHEVLSRSFILN